VAETIAGYRSGRCRNSSSRPITRGWFPRLWDDDWRCLGGTAALVEAIHRDRHLHARLVNPGDNATPPGHMAI
jgi:hypothetical protein